MIRSKLRAKVDPANYYPYSQSTIPDTTHLHPPTTREEAQQKHPTAITSLQHTNAGTETSSRVCTGNITVVSDYSADLVVTRFNDSEDTVWTKCVKGDSNTKSSSPSSLPIPNFFFSKEGWRWGEGGIERKKKEKKKNDLKLKTTKSGGLTPTLSRDQARLRRGKPSTLARRQHSLNSKTKQKTKTRSARRCSPHQERPLGSSSSCGYAEHPPVHPQIALLHSRRARGTQAIPGSIIPVIAVRICYLHTTLQAGWNERLDRIDL